MNMTGNPEELKVNRREIYRYLGIRSGEPDQATQALVESVLKELTDNVQLREFHQMFPLHVPQDELHTIDMTCFRTHSRSLEKNLRGCSDIIVMAATIGSKVDLLLRRYSLTNASRGVVMQAASAAMIEAWCNLTNDAIKTEAAGRGLYLRPRFSPGYGDFPLDNQRDIFQALQVEKRVGIALTESLLMIPSKSVTAVIGAGRDHLPCVREGCEACSKADCLYRRNSAAV